MGTCCCNGQGFPSDEISCLQQGGCTYSDGDNDPCGGGIVISCAVLGALRRYLHVESNADPVILLAAGGTIQGMYDLRDIILARSSLGERLLDEYSQHAERAMQLISTDPTLLREVLRVVLLDAFFGRAILSEHVAGDREAQSNRRYTNEMHEAGVAIFTQLRRLDPDGQLEEPLDFVERTSARFVGMTARQVLRELMEEREPSS